MTQFDIYDVNSTSYRFVHDNQSIVSRRCGGILPPLETFSRLLVLKW
jgi:hypothetical protein